MEVVDEWQNRGLCQGHLSHGKDLMAKEQKRQREGASFLQNFDNERAEELQAGSEKQSIFSKLVY